MTSNSRLTKIMGAILVSLFLMSQALGGISAQYSYDKVPADIPDEGQLVIEIDVPAQILSDVNVELQILHPYVGDLSAVVVSPAGTEVALFTNIGDGGDNFKNTIFDDEAETPLPAFAPFEGTFQAEGSLADFDGEEAKGVWQVIITDNSKLDAGTLECCSLYIEGNNGPVAVCQDVTVLAEKGMVANVSTDEIACGSADPDGDPLEIVLDPASPYPIGETEVTVTVTDDSGVSDSCTAVVTVLPTAYSRLEEAALLLADLVVEPEPKEKDPNDPNAVEPEPEPDPIAEAVASLEAALGGDVIWASSDSIADGQGGENGLAAMESIQAAMGLLDAADPNQALAMDLIAEAVSIVVDTAIADAAFQGADVAKAKELRCAGDAVGAWQAAADGLRVPEVEVEVVEVPTLDFDEDGDVDIDDLLTFADAVLAELNPPEPEPEPEPEK
jgi:subtilisin-like proprotein convertase family protein